MEYTIGKDYAKKKKQHINGRYDSTDRLEARYKIAQEVSDNVTASTRRLTVYILDSLKKSMADGTGKHR